MISCKHITKTFRERIVLNDLSYEFANSGFYLLYGESGSGKTTFLNILAGFLPFEEGCVKWGGHTFEGQIDHDAVAARFDYITQDTFFVDFLSVEDNLRLICEDDAKISALLTRFGLADKGKQMPATLSGGEKQRLAIIRAILSGKQVLFLDEPTAALDEENKTAVFRLLAELSGEMLILCSSHDGMARKYADHMIEFTKVKEKAAVSVTASEKVMLKAKKSMSAAPKKNNLTRYLGKWFRSKQRNRMAGVLFLLFLILSSVLCLFADFPQSKKEATLENIYNLHTVKLSVHNHRWEEISPSDEGIREVMLGYTPPLSPPLNAGADAPSNEEGLIPTPDYELSLDVLPYDADLFRLSHRIAHGSYFTAVNQVILSPEMAEDLAPGDPDSLIGTTITRNVYKLGDTEFEIVGIFDFFSEYEKIYMQSLGISYQDAKHYNPRDEIDRLFINSAFTAQFEEDEEFHDKGQRIYYLLFDSYKDMESYLNTYGQTLEETHHVAIYDLLYVDERFGFAPICYTLLPLAVFMVFFSTLFYIALKKTEFAYNNQFVAVFEYSGYGKMQVIRRFILLHILDLLKFLVIAEGAAFVISLAVNYINHKDVFIPYEIFTYNLPLILGYNLLVLLTALVAMNLLLGRVKVSSWYENLICTRDLI